MNLNVHKYAAPVLNRINANQPATLYVNMGFSQTGPGRAQVPTFADPVVVTAQVQAVTTADLRHLEGTVSQQPVSCSAYLYGEIDGLMREEHKGGDLLVFGGWEYLVTAVPEQWPTWCKVILTRQGLRAS